MAKRTQKIVETIETPAQSPFPYLYAFDAGNGTCKGISSQSGLITFEPVITSLTDKRGLAGEESKPRFSLRVEDTTLVFGLDDCLEHGRRDTMRRLNSMERYTSPDYFRLLNVLFLQTFAALRGNAEYIAPTGVISLPISQYNNAGIVEDIRGTLTGKHTLVDYDGCQLRLDIRPERLVIMPESAGALMHWAQNPTTLQRRENVSTAGLNLVIDIGYETTDCSLFEGMRYQKERAFSIPRAGMGVLVRRIQEVITKRLRFVDETRLDKALQACAGVTPGTVKRIEPSPGAVVDITRVYDQEVDELSNQIADRVLSLYNEPITRAIIAGGGAYHLASALRDRLPFTVEVSPSPDGANVIGAFTSLQIKMLKS